MSDEFYLNCLDLCLSYSRELEVCLSETGRSRAVDDLENRSQEGVELMDLDGTIEEAKMRNAIRSVCDALKDSIDSAVAQEQDFTMLREHIFGVAAEDAKTPKGDLHFGAEMMRQGPEVFTEYVRSALKSIHALAVGV